MVAHNQGSVVLFWVPTLKEAVPPSPGSYHLYRGCNWETFTIQGVVCVGVWSWERLEHYERAFLSPVTCGN